MNQNGNPASSLYAPLMIILRVVIYAALMVAVAQAVKHDAVHPMEDGYFGEISYTEIGQEILLFILFLFYLWLGFNRREIQSVAHIIALFFLASFFREFNFISDKWIYPVLAVLIVAGAVAIKNFRKIKSATVAFFSQPASAWFLSGLLITYIFSRMMGRSSFWRILYDENSYRIAKAATEEAIELGGNMIMIISALEFFLFYYTEKKKSGV